jgi:hypothetical protein
MDGEARSLTSVVCHLSSDSHSFARRLFSGAGRAAVLVEPFPLFLCDMRASEGEWSAERRGVLARHP